jgi:hypothetical protein
LNSEKGVSIGSFGGENPPEVALFTSNDVVTNFRTCCRRYQYRQFVGFINTILGGNYDVIKQVVTTDPAGTNLRSYCTPAYAGWRGSIRFKLFPFVDDFTEKRVRYTKTVGRLQASSDSFTITSAVPLQYNFQSGWNGCVISNEMSGDVLDVEIPYYSDQRFLTYPTTIPRPAFMWTGSIYNRTSPTQNFGLLDHVYEAIGQDFNLFFFLGVPPMWAL